MPVYREAGDFVCPGPSVAACSYELQQEGFNRITCCFQACNGLLLVLSDLVNVLIALRNVDPPLSPTSGIYTDAHRLVHLIAYYVYGPLDACLRVVNRYPRYFRPFQPNQPLDYAAEYRWVLNAVCMADRILREQLNTPSIVNPVSQVGYNDEFPDVPAYGVVELLLRIEADMRQATSVENLQAFFTTLRLQPQRNVELTGIPKIAFACQGRPPATTAGSTLPVFVITTSRDRWPDFRNIRTFIDNGRNARIGNAPIGDAAAVQTIRDASAALKLAHDNGARGFTQWSSELLQFRDNLVANQPNNARFNHTGERGLPMHCPGFAIAPRCMRCQVLFRYNANFSHDLQRIELRYRRGPYANVNEGMNCAECFAHFYCAVAHN